MDTDRSEGWEGEAEHFMAARSDIGTILVRRWAVDNLPPSSVIVDIGCGSGVPIARALIEDGFTVFGIDASLTLLAAFQRRFPAAEIALEAAQDSVFFHRTFDAAVSVGLLFLLSADDQRRLLQRVADALRPSGRLLFSAPRIACEWDDTLTGRRSLSLGEPAYRRSLEAAGLELVGRYCDQGGNSYFDAAKHIS